MKILYNEQQTKELGRGYQTVPVILETELPDFSASEAARRLGTTKPVFLLESADCTDKMLNGRFSYLGSDPEMTLRILNGKAVISGKEQQKEIECEDPASLIDSILEENKSPDLPGLPPFTGGFAGAFAYDFYKYSEPVLKMNNPNPDEFNDADLMFFKTVYAFDRVFEKLYIMTAVPADIPEGSYGQAVSLLNDSYSRIMENREDDGLRTLTGPVHTGLSCEAYSSKVEQAKAYIREGDIFQVVPSNRMRAAAEKGCSLFPVYEQLRQSNPSPYMYYLNFGDFEAAGSSPETLLRKTGSQLLTVPIAGTRPRGKDEQQDHELEAELLEDPKELAEHNMLVDLARNDIGKIACTGSVRVRDYLNIRKFRNVMHLCTGVTGQIKDGMTSMDALSSLLPAGTLSGAPKIRACEIIEELEDEKRGLYGGSAGYIGTNGNMDMCIAIRTAFRKNQSVIIQSGGGVVADSDPQTEYMETRHKAQAVLSAMEAVS
ncbi:MAG: anthranilate synthase component I family protein [Eubacteriaceae bacterium]|jgi:anthranilate synthase component 1